MRRLIFGTLLLTVVMVFVLPYWALSRQKRPAAVPAAAAENASAPDPAAPAAAQTNFEGDVLPSAQSTDLETYLVGVVAGEMPASFQPEALKAQAVAARTYAVREMAANGGAFPGGQAYASEAELQQRWGDRYSYWHDRVASAVADTAGEILTYDEEPILAVFSAESAGMTETAGNVWSTDLPYLQSVDSPGDLTDPAYETTVRLRGAAVRASIADAAWTDAPVAAQLQILERTEAGYVKTIRAAGKDMSGRAFREALGLRSSHFTLAGDGDDLLVTTQGHGHGAGMSQYGANAMAAAGSTYREILSHYYPGAVLTKN